MKKPINKGLSEGCLSKSNYSAKFRENNFWHAGMVV